MDCDQPGSFYRQINSVCIFSCKSYISFTYADNALFDASQYAFFGQDGAEDVELEGLEDEVNDVPTLGFGDDEYHLFDKEEVVTNYFSCCA